MADFDTSHTHNAICPHCRHEHGDSWEFDFGSDEVGEVECSSCDEPFWCQRNVTITYSTSPIKEPAAPEGAPAWTESQIEELRNYALWSWRPAPEGERHE